MRRTAVLSPAVALLFALAGCSDPAPGEGGVEGHADSMLGHVHGLGIDPADGTLYAASHLGVFRVAEDGSVARVADRWQDTMAFTVVGPRHFLASGHPDMREGLPPHLGLIESTDAAQTWQPLSLQGEADFHALEAADGRVYGYDSASGRLLMTEDRCRWEELATAPILDLAVDPHDANRLLATAPDGSVKQYRTGARVTERLLDTPRLYLLDWPVSDVLVGLSAEGAVYVSRDGARSWTRTGQVPGQPQALDVTPDQWHVATSHGILVSDDDGRSWDVLVSGS